MRDSQKYGIIATVIFMILLFLLLWFIYIDPIQQPEEEVVEIEFADVIEDAGGFSKPEPSPETTPLPAQTEPVPPAPSVKSNPPVDPVITQEDEEALAMQKQKEKEERERIEQERLLAQQKAAQEKAEREAREAAERAAAEQAAREAAAKAAAEQAAKDRANALMGGAFKGQGQGGTGGKTTGGSGGGDNPVKNGISGGNGWSAKGRVLKGSIPQPVISDFPEGVVVVSFRIDASGRVSSPTIAKGTTISETAVRNACLNAAKQAMFTGGVDEVEGTITFNFKVN